MPKIVKRVIFWCVVVLAAVLMRLPNRGALAQLTHVQPADSVTIQGTLADSAHRVIAEALVQIKEEGHSGVQETRTDASGQFVFSGLSIGKYTLQAEKSGRRSYATPVTAAALGDHKTVDLILDDSQDSSASTTTRSPAMKAMDFSDAPNFTIAGVTDWTAAGGHGSDSILQTSEALARDTLALKASGMTHGSLPSDASPSMKAAEDRLRAAVDGAPKSFEANHQLGEFYLKNGEPRNAISPLQVAYDIDSSNRTNEFSLALAYKQTGNLVQAHDHLERLLVQYETADLRRVAGDVDEKKGDPLAAVRQYERAVRMDPSEENYFAWGSELLLHRAVWQAQEVFRKGTEAYSHSARMLTAYGSALFAGALYDEAALRLCDASDVNPADPEPYLFMGKIEIASPNPLPCVQQKLARFVKEQPENSLANYFYAMAIWKQQAHPPEVEAMRKVEALLIKAATIDVNCGDAYLQLGNLYSAQHDMQRAINSYTKAIQSSPQLSDAHYRLGVAYDRIGEHAKATHEFRLHDEVKKQQAAIVEQQRIEVKQFRVTVPREAKNSTSR